jgi:mRNA interferase RelE/StbE
MYEVRLSRRALKYYNRVGPPTARRLNQCFQCLESNPFGGGDIKPLKGMRGVFRFRVGNLRVVYEVDVPQRVVKVSAILPRGEAYKR